MHTCIYALYAAHIISCANAPSRTVVFTECHICHHTKDTGMEKKTSPENKLVLKQILAQEGNDRCADCKKATYPRWASWNIGILICIRCSGVHRSLGTHISKVRSIDLDTWNDMQLEKLKVTGNAVANRYWEAQLPPNYVPDESKLVNFIKTKYELRRWVAAGPPPALPPKLEKTSAQVNSRAHTTQSSLRTHATSAAGAHIPTRAPATTSTTPVSASIDLLGLSHTQQASPAQVRTHAAQLTQPPQQQLQQPTSTQPRPNTTSSQADVKSSILSLYAKPTSNYAPRTQQSSTNTFNSVNNTTYPSTSSLNSLGSAGTSMSSLSSLGSLSSLSTTGATTQTARAQPSSSSRTPNVIEEDNFSSVWN